MTCKTSQFFKDLHFFCEDRQHESSTETLYMCWAENREKKPGLLIGFLFSKSVCTLHSGFLISNKWHTQYFVSVPNCMQMLIHFYFNGFIFFLLGFWVDITGLDAYPSPFPICLENFLLPRVYKKPLSYWANNIRLHITRCERCSPVSSEQITLILCEDVKEAFCSFEDLSCVAIFSLENWKQFDFVCFRGKLSEKCLC